MIIAVDGPAASGKGTLAAGLGSHYRLPHLDTGLLYRAVGHAAAADENSDAFERRAVAAALALDIDALDPISLSSGEIGNLASKVAVFPQVRRALFGFQRDFALRPGGAILDGRDIGTVICPEAEVKLFIIASAAARAERRARQFEVRGRRVDRAALLAQIEERDARDRAAPHGGFRPAPDAHLLDTTDLDIEATLRAAVAIVDAVNSRKAGFSRT